MDLSLVSILLRRTSLLRIALLGVLIAMTAACERASLSGPSSTRSVNIPAELAYCADQVNRYRTSIGRALLSRSPTLEDFAAQAAKDDGLAHLAHHLFTMTNGGGTARAETEILWWRGHAIRTVIQQGLEQMWQAGPSGEHYDIIAGPYAEIGCGIFVNGGEVTVAQDFR